MQGCVSMATKEKVTGFNEFNELKNAYLKIGKDLPRAFYSHEITKVDLLLEIQYLHDLVDKCSKMN